MKKLIIILFVLLHITMVHAQKWEHTIGLPNRDEYGGKLLEHYDHGYLISATMQQGSGNYHGWLVKTDINGEVLWEKQIGQLPEHVTITGVRYDEQGNIYTYGWLHNQNFEHEFPFIVKLNACGEKLWCRLFALEGYSFGFFNDAIFLENGDLLCLAIMPEDDPSNNNRILLFRLTSEGELLWKKGYATHEDHPYYGDPYGETINKFGDQYIISGTVYSPYPNAPNPYHVWQRPMFIGIDEDFNEQWIVEFGINDSLLGKARSVVAINDTLFMGLGRHRFVENGILDQNSWMMFFNYKGEQVGYHMIEDEQLGPEVFENLIQYAEKIDGDKYLATAGYMYNEDDANWGEMIIDTAGNVYDYTIRENSRPSGSNYLSKTFDGKFAFSTSYELPSQSYADVYHYKLNENLEQDTLYPGNYTYDSLCKGTIESGVIDLAGCGVVTSIGEIPTLEQYRENLQSIGITASPNPSNTGEVLLEMENTGLFPKLQIKVFDVFGNQIHTESILPHQGAVRLQTSQWPAGMYLATVLSNGEVKGKTKFVVR